MKRRQRTHAASGGASEALPHEVGARPSRSEPKLNTHALYPSRSELRGITFKNKETPLISDEAIAFFYAQVAHDTDFRALKDLVASENEKKEKKVETVKPKKASAKKSK